MLMKKIAFAFVITFCVLVCVYSAYIFSGGFLPTSANDSDESDDSGGDVQDNQKDESTDIVASGFPVTVISQGWKYTIKSVTRSNRLPEGVTKDMCVPSLEAESYFDEIIVSEDGEIINDEYFFIIVELGQEKYDKDMVNELRDDEIYLTSSSDVYGEMENSRSCVVLKTDYLSASCWDPVEDADDMTKGYYSVDFRDGYVEMTRAYVVKKSFYDRYDNWMLLLDMRGMSVDSYYSQLEYDGVPPYERVLLPRLD